MHISLDSALGRQRRLNSVGESVLQIAPDAAAAYSLRSLTGGDPDVVRVRRESDNTEKDFSGSQIESGEMARWVNEQPTLPLDLRELDTNTGERDGALIEAAAAYSLRKLKEDFTGDVVEVRRNVDGETEGFTADEVTDGTLESFVNASFDDELPLDQATGAAAAYSLRNLKASGTDVTTSGDTAGDTTGKYVVQVRRRSDDAVKSFTAAEVADGTLTDWVNTDVDVYTSDFSAGTDGWTGHSTTTVIGNTDAVGGVDDTLLISNATESSGYAIGKKTLLYGNGKVRVTGKARRNSVDNTYSNLVFTTASGSGQRVPIALPNADTWYDLDFTLTLSNANLWVTRSPSTSITTIAAGAEFYLKDIQMTSTEVDGHVKTWYDQSGSDNDAVQTTDANQPKIVEGGTLLKDGNLNPSIKFTTADATFMTASGVSITQPYSFFLKVQADKTAAEQQLIDSVSTNPAFVQIVTDGRLLYNNGSAIYTSTDLDNIDADFIHSGFINGSSTDAFTNGASALTDTDVGSNGLSGLTIGKHRTLSSNYFDGQFSELIIYNSDQSTKRRAIEENIANHYDITLAAFSRDGTVSTWYDQSGSTPANNATQTDPTKQPDIVVNGNLVTGGINFDGANDYFDLTSTITQSGELSYFFALDGLVSSPNTLIGTSGGASPRVRCESSNLEIKSSTTENNYSTSAWTANSGKSLVSFNRNAANLTSAYRDGAEIGTAATIPDNFNHNRLFKLDDANASNFNGKCQEVIIYDSDQSDNRTAIEANIGETYGITAIPAANDTVNGYVQTWYDQSGEGNDAEQPTADYQPKIVGEVTPDEPHAFLGAIEFDGTDDVLNFTEIDFSTNSWMLSAVVNWDGTDSAIVGGGAVQWALRIANSNNFSARAIDGTIHNFDPTATITTGDGLFTVERSSDVLSGYYDGDFDDASPAITASSEFKADKIGPYGSFYGSSAVKEIIIYDSDQSSNRQKIEENIAAAYDGITLS